MRYKDIYCNVVYEYQKNGKPTKCPITEESLKKLRSYKNKKLWSYRIL